jgi:hypothetical protein
LLKDVREKGCSDNYKGIRISKNGRRFVIEKAKVWNLIDEKGEPYGQAATFCDWEYI